MPSLGLVVLMLLPLVASAALLLAAPSQLRRASALRSLWLVPVAIVATGDILLVPTGPYRSPQSSRHLPRASLPALRAGRR